MVLATTTTIPQHKDLWACSIGHNASRTFSRSHEPFPSPIDTFAGFGTTTRFREPRKCRTSAFSWQNLSGGSRRYNYERLGDSSPGPPARAMTRPAEVPPLTLHASTSSDEDGIVISPASNPADFQAAIGFAGLIMPNIYLSEGQKVTPYGSRGSTPYGSGDFDGISFFGDAKDDQTSFFPSESERIPLIDPNHLQPVSGAEPSPGGQRHDRSRSSFQSVGFDWPALIH